jgi:SAM-dependent methyltransferase
MLSDDYSPQFFDAHESWREEYERIADLLSDLLRFETVLDIGCGNGFIIQRLSQKGKDVIGIDGSLHAAARYANIRVMDVSEPMDIGEQRDLVICTEVAEHIVADRADVLIDNICRSSKMFVLFSAARPGFGGHLHVNEQEHDYWIDKFRSRGFVYEIAFTKKLRAAMGVMITELWWFPANVILFRKPACA